MSQNSQQNTCARVSFLITLQATPEFCEIFKNTFFYRTLSVAASESNYFINVGTISYWIHKICHNVNSFACLKPQGNFYQIDMIIYLIFLDILTYFLFKKNKGNMPQLTALSLFFLLTFVDYISFGFSTSKFTYNLFFLQKQPSQWVLQNRFPQLYIGKI